MHLATPPFVLGGALDGKGLAFGQVLDLDVVLPDPVAPEAPGVPDQKSRAVVHTVVLACGVSSLYSVLTGMHGIS